MYLLRCGCRYSGVPCVFILIYVCCLGIVVLFCAGVEDEDLGCVVFWHQKASICPLDWRGLHWRLAGLLLSPFYEGIGYHYAL